MVFGVYEVTCDYPFTQESYNKYFYGKQQDVLFISWDLSSKNKEFMDFLKFSLTNRELALLENLREDKSKTQNFKSILDNRRDYKEVIQLVDDLKDAAESFLFLQGKLNDEVFYLTNRTSLFYQTLFNLKSPFGNKKIENEFSEDEKNFIKSVYENHASKSTYSFQNIKKFKKNMIWKILANIRVICLFKNDAVCNNFFQQVHE